MARCDTCMANKVCDHNRFGFENCGNYISAADVAPKSEVDWHREAELNAQRIIELESEKDALIKNYADCMKDYAREIFEEIEFDIHQLMFEREEHRAIAIEGVIAELKKKYTEDSDES